MHDENSSASCIAGAPLGYRAYRVGDSLLLRGGRGILAWFLVMLMALCGWLLPAVIIVTSLQEGANASLDEVAIPLIFLALLGNGGLFMALYALPLQRQVLISRSASSIQVSTRYITRSKKALYEVPGKWTLEDKWFSTSRSFEILLLNLMANGQKVELIDRSVAQFRWGGRSLVEAVRMYVEGAKPYSVF